MNVSGAFVFLAGSLLGAQYSSAQATSTSPLTAVANVDLRRYAGKWYEIARYPNRFQRNCQSDTTAVYTLRDDGKVQVVNACREKNGKVTTARGTAKVVDKKTNAKLKVTFFWPFYGDYWVIGLSPDYQYAIVGEPSRKYLWILSRAPIMKETTYQEVLRLVETLGYQPGKLQKTNQSEYVAQRQFRGTLSAVALGGGAPCEILQDVREAGWFPDGTKLAVSHDVEGKDRIEFPVGKVRYETSGYLSDLRFSPQGDGIAFFEHPVKCDDCGSIDVVDLAGHASMLSDGYQAEEGLAWAPTQKTIFFSGQVGNGFSLIVYELTLSGQRRTVLVAPDELWVLDVSKDSKLLVSRGESQERIMALATGSKSGQEISWLDSFDNAALSADGQTLLFTDGSTAVGFNYALCLHKTDGSPVVRLTREFIERDVKNG